MASLLPVVFVLAAVVGLGFVSWIVVPKGPQQTYVYTTSAELTTDRPDIQSVTHQCSVDTDMLLPSLGNHIYGTTSPSRRYGRCPAQYSI
jgi:hypothetical protein